MKVIIKLKETYQTTMYPVPVYEHRLDVWEGDEIDIFIHKRYEQLKIQITKTHYIIYATGQWISYEIVDDNRINRKGVKKKS